MSSLTEALAEKLLKALAIVALAVASANLVFVSRAHTYFPEYQKYVHTCINTPNGNLTYLEKPMFPIFINDSQIQIGKNWSIIAPLEANHTYHTYCYGRWINNGSEPKTDYDIYAYNPLGEMETYHTEAAGLPEHLGTTTDDPYFSPKHSGNYTFVIRNDPRESKSAQNATFMIIENVQCNTWLKHYTVGKDNNDQPTLRTSWAYEFITENPHVEVVIKVPETLDMYEARLYLMADPQSKNKSIISNVPLAWEPGLYGDRSEMYGGYNLQSKEYRGQAYASCEYYGQDMLLNYTSPHIGKSLYHLVLIAEAGYGTIDFVIKTNHESASLKPQVNPSRGYAQNETVIAYISNSTNLASATLQYSINNWRNTTSISMQIENDRTCTTTIPKQQAGTSVHYKVKALDVFENILTANGNYTVKHATTLNITAPQTVTLSQNITIKGKLTPETGDRTLTVTFTFSNITKQITCQTLPNGEFKASFKPETIGTWKIQATFAGDQSMYECISSQLPVKVEEPSIFAKYSLYIGGAIGAVGIIGAFFYWKKTRQ